MKTEMKLDTVDINNVHIATAKDWKGKGLNLTEKVIDESIEHFNKSDAIPYITLDHNPGLTESVKQFFKAASLGYASKMWRDGKKWLVNFKEVPKLLAELIDAGTFKQRSIEFWKKFKHADGRILDNVLEAVTLHGGNGLPAMSNLDDIKKFFKIDGEVINNDVIEQDIKEKVTIFKQEENLMEITDKDYQEFIQMKSDKKKLDKDFSETAKAKADAEAEVVQMKSDNETLKKTLEEKEAADKIAAEKAIEMKNESDKVEAESFIDSVITAKKILPKYKDMEVENYIRFKNDEDETKLVLFKEKLESADEVVNFEPITKNIEDGETTNFKSEVTDANIMNAKTDLEAMDAYKDVNEYTKMVMKRDDVDFITATETINKQQEELQ